MPFDWSIFKGIERTKTSKPGSNLLSEPFWALCFFRLELNLDSDLCVGLLACPGPIGTHPVTPSEGVAGDIYSIQSFAYLHPILSVLPLEFSKTWPRAYNKPLRPVVLFTSAITLIWSLVLAVKFIQDRQSDTETKRMKVFDLILSILFFIVAGLEVFGLVAATTQRIVLARIYFILAGLGAFVTFSAELIRLIAHFVVKHDLIDDCRNELTGAKAETLSGAIASIDGQEAQRLCEDDWQRGLWWDLGWLVLTSCLALLFTGIVGAYYHQLLDPSFTRTTVSNEVDQQARGAADEGVNVFPMEPYRQMTYHTPHQQDMPFVPPQYTMPPEYRPVHGALGDHGVDDKKDGLERVSLSDNPPSRM